MGVMGIELEQAVEIIISHTGPIEDTELLPIIQAEGRITAGDVTAAFDQPPFPRSPLDGYSFLADSVKGASENAPAVLPVIAAVYAGEYLEQEISVGEAVKITTGAPIPKGCNCVVRQEDVTVENGNILVRSELKAYENYCFPGEDYKKGSKLLNKGDEIHFVEMGILASAGYGQIQVYRRPRIALLVTGDELLAPGNERLPGKIYNSNLYMLHGRLNELGMDVICAEQLKDEPEAAAKRLAEISAMADAIITTGGVSVGEKDIFHQVLPILGCERLFWRVRLKPGTPAMFSVLNHKPMLNLSGNPFAAATTFELLARPMLHQLAGNERLATKRIQAVLANGFEKESRGRRFVRAAYHNGAVKIPEIYKHASGLLASMKGCNCLIDIQADTKRLTAGETVTILLL